MCSPNFSLVEVDQPAAVVALLVGHLGEHVGAGRVVLAQALGDIGVDAAVLFLVGDRQGEDLPFGQIGEIAHGAQFGGRRAGQGVGTPRRVIVCRQMASNCRPTAAQENRASSKRRAAMASPRRRSASANSRTISAANALGVSATRQCLPGSTARPSTPSVVETTGRPSAIASNALRRVPLPTRNGITETSPARYSRTDVFDKAGELPCHCLARGPGDQHLRRIAPDHRHACVGPRRGHERPDLVHQELDAVDVGAAVHGAGEHHGARRSGRQVECIEVQVDAGVDRLDIGEAEPLAQDTPVTFRHRHHRIEAAQRGPFERAHLRRLALPHRFPQALRHLGVALEDLCLDVVGEYHRGYVYPVGQQHGGMRKIDHDQIRACRQLTRDDIRAECRTVAGDRDRQRAGQRECPHHGAAPRRRPGGEAVAHRGKIFLVAAGVRRCGRD